MATEISKGLKIRYWIAIGFSIPVALSVLAPIFVVNNLGTVNEAVEEVDRVSFSFQELIGLVEGVQRTSRSVRGYLLKVGSVDLEEYNNAKKLVIDQINATREHIKNEEQLKLLDELESDYNEYTKINDQILQVIQTKGQAEGIQYWKQAGGNELVANIFDNLAKFQEKQQEFFQEFSKKQNDGLESLRTVVLLSSGTIVLASLIFAFIIYFNITGRLTDITTQIATSSNEIAATIEQQDRTASQQAASVNETTTTVDELGASSRQSTEQAEAAANAAREALQLAENGDQAVQQTLHRMNDLKEKVGAIAEQIMRLSEQTNQIGNISALVSDIANRTNMLALNAAVEAVRAGEHGKGFAVVAAEIRKLADQSKQSAGKINTLVSQIQNSINTTVMVTDEGTKTVDSGMQVVQNTAMAFAGVRESVNNVVMNNQQISLNIRQQSTAFQQVLDAMNSINQGARETSAGITQSRIGTQKLTEVTEVLKELV